MMLFSGNSIADLIDHSCSFNTFKLHLKQYIRINNLLFYNISGVLLSVSVLSTLHIDVFNKIKTVE